MEQGVPARHTGRVEALRHAVLDSDAVTSHEIRAAAATGGELPEPLGWYAAKVRDESYRVTDGDIAAVVAAGYGEEAVFEVTVAAALGAALHRLDAGLRAVRGES